MSTFTYRCRLCLGKKKISFIEHTTKVTGEVKCPECDGTGRVEVDDVEPNATKPSKGDEPEEPDYEGVICHASI